MAKRALLAATLCAFLCLAGCGAGENGQTDNGEKPEPVQQELEGGNSMQPEQNTSEPCTVDTKITEVINDPVFEEYGRLIFPVDEAYYSGDTLGSLRLTWYNNIDPDETVKIVNTLTRKRKKIQKKKIRACSSSEAIRVKSLPYAAPAAALLM